MYNKENLEKKTKAELVKIGLELQNHIDVLEEANETLKTKVSDMQYKEAIKDFETTETLDADSIYKDRVTSDTGNQSGEKLGRER